MRCIRPEHDRLADIPQTGAKADQVKQNLTKIKLPPGFHISLYALVPDARHIAVGPQGVATFVGTRKTKVWAVTDRARGGVGDEVKEFAPTLPKKIPNGPVLLEGRLPLHRRAEPRPGISGGRVLLRKRRRRRRRVVPEGELIPKSEESYNHTARVVPHRSRQQALHPAGPALQRARQGEARPVPQAGIGGIIRMDRDGKNREVFATGLRNPVGMDFNPKDKSLWTNDNQVDGMGDDQPPGRNEPHRQARARLRLPVVWRRPHRTNEYKNDTPPASVVFPEVEQAAHAADLGLMFYTGTMFPEKYRGAIFSTQHGSWNRTVPVGARVMVTFLKEDGHVAGKSEPFAEGWNDNGYYLGRPVDVAQLHDGSLLVSDDLVGALYRIWYDGK